MLKEISLALIQAATEFLPISSSGHLALIANINSQPDLFLFTVLHMASLLAVVIFTRKEIMKLLDLRSKEHVKMWGYLIIATIPAGLFGFLFRHLIEQTFSSLLFIGIAFFFTGFILLGTKLARVNSNMNGRNALIIGLFQLLALFPGVSRSGMTISAALYMGIQREEAAKFSFLLFIPLSIGAFVLELNTNVHFDLALLAAFFTCLVMSVVFLHLLLFLIKKRKFWTFSIYCFVAGIVSLILYFVKMTNA